MRREGELSAAAIDQGWPHQVVLPARVCERDGYNEIHEFCRDLTLCSRGYALYHYGQWFHVYCFKEAADAQSSGGDLGARGASRSSAVAAPTGRGGKKVSAELNRARPQGRHAPASRLGAVKA